MLFPLYQANALRVCAKQEELEKLRSELKAKLLLLRRVLEQGMCGALGGS